MTCVEAAERITALVDGEVPAAEREALERHLSACPSCREALEGERAVAERLRALPRPALPAGFSVAVMERVRAAGAPAARGGRVVPLWPWIAAASAVAAGILAMATVGSDRGSRGAEVALKAAPPAALLEDPSGGFAAPAAESKPEAPRGAREEADDESRREKDSREKGLAAPAEASKEDRAAAGPAPGPDRGGAPPPEPATPAGPAPVVPAPAPPPVPPAGPAGTPPGKKVGAKAEAGEAEGERSRDGAGSEPRRPGEEGAAGRDAKAPPVRVAILFRSASPEAAREAVDAVLLARKGIALESRPWKDAAEVDSSTGRARREIEKEAREWKDAPAALPLDRVREVRIRAGDLDKLREALGAASVLREAGLLTLQGPLTDKSVEEARKLLGSLADLEKAAEGGGSAAAGKRGDAGREVPRSGKPPPADPGEPVPPPAPTEETLRRLAEAPPPRAGAAGGKDPDAEVWVEIHVVGGTAGSGGR